MKVEDKEKSFLQSLLRDNHPIGSHVLDMGIFKTERIDDLQ